jgi:hypothetical protein
MSFRLLNFRLRHVGLQHTHARTRTSKSVPTVDHPLSLQCRGFVDRQSSHPYNHQLAIAAHCRLDIIQATRISHTTGLYKQTLRVGYHLHFLISKASQVVG